MLWDNQERLKSRVATVLGNVAVERFPFTVLETLGLVGALSQRFPGLGVVVLGLHHTPHDIYRER